MKHLLNLQGISDHNSPLCCVHFSVYVCRCYFPLTSQRRFAGICQKLLPLYSGSTDALALTSSKMSKNSFIVACANRIIAMHERIYIVLELELDPGPHQHLYRFTRFAQSGGHVVEGQLCLRFDLMIQYPDTADVKVILSVLDVPTLLKLAVLRLTVGESSGVWVALKNIRHDRISKRERGVLVESNGFWYRHEHKLSTNQLLSPSTLDHLAIS